MTKQREAKLSKKIMDALRAQGYYAFKIHGGPTMTAGLPDIIVCAEGVFVGLETKNPETRTHTSARQDFVHDEMRKAEGHVYVVCGVNEALQAVLEATSCVLNPDLGCSGCRRS